MGEPAAETGVALVTGPRMAEHVLGLVIALEAASRTAEFEESKYLWEVAVPGSE